MPILPYIGVVFSLVRLLALDNYHFDFLMSLKATLTYPSLSNSVLQYERRLNEISTSQIPTLKSILTDKRPSY